MIWRPTGGHAYARIDRAHEPGTWLTAARRTADPLITAWEETPGPGAMVSGSLPGDAYVHAALDAAGARPGRRPVRVLHIGTEYMAALLAHGLPPWSVTSTNSQTPTVQAEQTFQRLAAPVHVRAGNALGGLRAQEEPYDHVVMTHALRGLVPGTLPNMVRAGGTVVLTLGQDLAPVNVLVRLVVTVRGRAEGRFLQPVSPHDAPWAPGHAPAPFPPPPADSPDRQYSVRLPSDLWPRNGFPRALWAIGLRLKRV
ncbi:hypothetical protein ACIP5N_21225 [Streptomyces sp. NPDC088768]|uniref:hypothetical protein n=1 Tax=Streptomyces sp. NPDC088768 TaxID=3365894 RepID=UPI00381EEA43